MLLSCDGRIIVTPTVFVGTGRVVKETESVVAKPDRTIKISGVSP